MLHAGRHQAAPLTHRIIDHGVTSCILLASINLLATLSRLAGVGRLPN